MTDRLPTLATACTSSGVLGVLVGVLTIAWPPDVPETQWSYPFPTGFYVVVAVVLAATHLLTALGFVGVLAADPHQGSRPAVVTLWLAVGGFVLLAAAELLSGVIGGSDVDSAAAGGVGAMFGVGSLLTAVGGLVAGAVIARRGAWTGVGRYAVLASGIAMIALVTPANAAGADTLVRTSALILWSLTFIPIGLALRRR